GPRRARTAPRGPAGLRRRTARLSRRPAGPCPARRRAGRAGLAPAGGHQDAGGPRFGAARLVHSGGSGRMRIAVTGASGFCGGHVARTAAMAGHDVVCVGRRPGPVGTHVAWDAAGPVGPDLAGADAVIHLAAAVGDPRPGAATEERFRRVNVEGTARLMDAAAGIKVVYVSSASVYAPGGYAAPVREDAPIGRQRTAYGRTKAAGERVAVEAGAVALRPRAVYGPGDPHLLPRLRRAVRAGMLLLPGPDTTLSLTAVENLAGACLAALDWPAGAYNVADAEPYPR